MAPFQQRKGAIAPYTLYASVAAYRPSPEDARERVRRLRVEGERDDVGDRIVLRSTARVRSSNTKHAHTHTNTQVWHYFSHGSSSNDILQDVRLIPLCISCLDCTWQIMRMLEYSRFCAIHRCGCDTKRGRIVATSCGIFGMGICQYVSCHVLVVLVLVQQQQIMKGIGRIEMIPRLPR